MDSPLVHILVINWNGLEHLADCFSTLLQSPYPNAKYILVDNASDDESVAYVAAHFGNDERVEILQCPGNLGWSGGNNYAMERSLEAGAAYIFLINNDTATAPDALEMMVTMMEADETLGAVAPKMVLFDYPEIINSVGLTGSIIGSAWDLGVGRLDAPQWNEVKEVIGVCGGAWMIRASVLHKTGLLPEEFDIYLDDYDLSLRIWDAGYRIQTCPEAVVRHKFSASMGEGKRAQYKYYLNTRNRYRVMLRNFPLRTWPKAFVYTGVGEVRALGRAILDGEFWRVGAHLKVYGSTCAYFLKAMRARRAHKKRGRSIGRFWHFIDHKTLFCPGLIMAEDGWYPAQNIVGQPYRAFAKHAYLNVEAGTHILHYATPYPELGPVRIKITQDYTVLETLEYTEAGSKTIACSKGRLEFEAENNFYAETTGAIVDQGGWLNLDTGAH